MVRYGELVTQSRSDNCVVDVAGVARTIGFNDSGSSFSFNRSPMIGMFFAINSTPHESLPSASATCNVVPLPANGSSTRHGIGSPALHPHEGEKPSVVARVIPMPRYCASFAEPYRLPRTPSRVSRRAANPGFRSTTLAHCAPHLEQHPFSLVLALIIGATKRGGHIAKNVRVCCRLDSP